MTGTWMPFAFSRAVTFLEGLLAEVGWMMIKEWEEREGKHGKKQALPSSSWTGLFPPLERLKTAQNKVDSSRCSFIGQQRKGLLLKADYLTLSVI